MQEKYDLYSKFDIEKHKNTFVNYLEVIITEDGTIHYAVPSHQEYMIMLAMKKNDWTREELRRIAQSDTDAYCDFMVWLSKVTQAVSVWNNFISFYSINSAQWRSLKDLKSSGLFHGYVPSKPLTLDEYIEEKYETSYGTSKIW